MTISIIASFFSSLTVPMACFTASFNWLCWSTFKVNIFLLAAASAIPVKSGLPFLQGYPKFFIRDSHSKALRMDIINAKSRCFPPSIAQYNGQEWRFMLTACPVQFTRGASLEMQHTKVIISRDISRPLSAFWARVPSLVLTTWNGRLGKTFLDTEPNTCNPMRSASRTKWWAAS